MNLSAEIIGSVRSVTKKWAKQRKAEERRASSKLRRYDALTHVRRESQKDIAWEVIPEAYMKASSANTLPAHARQIMYAARGEIQERTGKSLGDQYFIQTLLPEFMRENPDVTADWDVVFDARGHFEEPHTKRIVPLGTLDVREYLAKVRSVDTSLKKVSFEGLIQFPTHGPGNRYGAILFVEKEGFMPLFKRVKLAERYDIAIMSTKGMSVTAARSVVDLLCTRDRGVPLLVLHDFDKSGFSIAATLHQDTKRYEFKNYVDVVDVGLRLDDVEKWSLESEEVSYKGDPTQNLIDNGATGEEISFLFNNDWPHRGRRVELNAFTSAQLVEFIEGKLKENGIKKVVPDRACVEAAYRRALIVSRLEKDTEKRRKEISREVEKKPVPKGLLRKIRSRLKKNPELSWDQAVAKEAVNERSIKKGK